MMTKLILMLCLVVGTSAAFAQKNKGTTTTTPTATEPVKQPAAAPAPAAKHMEVYRMAKSYADFNTAAVALHYQLAEDPTNMALKDSLAVMYFAMGANLQCIALGKELLEKDENNQRMLELVAISYQNIGALKESLESYEKLYKLSNSAFHLYQIATIQFTLKRTYECTLSLNQLINHPQSGTEKVSIAIDRGRQQEVILKAAAYNVLGVLQKENNGREEARKSFQMAKELDKEFLLPQANLMQMDEEDKPKPATPGGKK
jgi:tetratricopeptide (TPR) repeat protein